MASGRQPGAPSLADASRMRMNAETGAVATSNRYHWQLPVTNDEEMERARNEFPIVPVPKDPYDDTANIKWQFGAAQKGQTNWMVPFERSDAEFLLRKRDAQEKAEFDAWTMQKFDVNDPAQNLMLQNIAPELFQRREEVIDSTQALVSAYAKLRLRGAKSLSDLELEWLIETGRLTLPQGPIWNPIQWRERQGHAAGLDDAAFNAQRYRFGLFSPIRWITRDKAGWKPNALNPADIRGDPDRKYTPTAVPYPGPNWANVWGLNIPYPGAGSNTHNRVDEPQHYVRPGDDKAYQTRVVLTDATPGLPRFARPDAE